MIDAYTNEWAGVYGRIELPLVDTMGLRLDIELLVERLEPKRRFYQRFGSRWVPLLIKRIVPWHERMIRDDFTLQKIHRREMAKLLGTQGTTRTLEFPVYHRRTP